MNSVITKSLLDKAMSYVEYRHLIMKLLAEDKTTGPKQGTELLEYTKINKQRMDRLDKTVKLLPELIEKLQAFPKPMYWVVLTEAWCGDASQNVPVIAKMADASPSIELFILLRDEYLEVMDAYLTNGSRSIPKLVCLDANNLQEMGLWGPRPAALQELVMTYKKNPDEPYAEFVKKVQLWYAKDKTESVQQEFMTLLDQWSAGNASAKPV